MEHTIGWCFHGIYNGGLGEDKLHVAALYLNFVTVVTLFV